MGPDQAERRASSRSPPRATTRSASSASRPTDINSTFENLKTPGLPGRLAGLLPGGRRRTRRTSASPPTSRRRPTRRRRRRSRRWAAQGNLVHLTGNNVDSNTQRRIAGVQKAVDETGGKVKLLQTITDIDKDLQTAQKAVADLLAAKGTEISAHRDHGVQPGRRRAEASRSPSCRSRSSRSTTTPPILAGIKDGSVSGTVAQNPVGPGVRRQLRAREARRAAVHDEGARRDRRLRLVRRHQGQRRHLRPGAPGLRRRDHDEVPGRAARPASSPTCTGESHGHHDHRCSGVPRRRRGRDGAHGCRAELPQAGDDLRRD